MQTLNLAIVIHEINNLLLLHPELRDDEIFRADMIEAETSAIDLLRQIELCRREAAALASGIAGTITEMEQRQARFERREQAMRGLAFRILQAANLKKIELPESTLSIRNGSRKLIGESDPAMLPDHFCRIRRELDRAAIRKALEDGATVAGFELSNAEPTLSIRTK